MAEKKVLKTNKNLYLPNWIIELLDEEGQKYDGPGIVASAAISSFCEMKNEEKIRAIQKYRNEEIRRAYSDTHQNESEREEKNRKIESFIKKNILPYIDNATPKEALENATQVIKLLSEDDQKKLADLLAAVGPEPAEKKKKAN